LSLTNVVDSNVWNHIAATYDGFMYRLYANGVEVKNGSYVATPLKQPVTWIGRVGSSYFRGAIREVRLWKRALSAVELQQNMNRRLTGTESGLVGDYHLDEYPGLLQHVVVDRNILTNYPALEKKLEQLAGGKPRLFWFTPPNGSE